MSDETFGQIASRCTQVSVSVVKHPHSLALSDATIV